MPDSQRDQPVSRRVRAAAASGGRFAAWVVAAGAALLLAMIAAANLDPPAPPIASGPPAASATPTPADRREAERLYVFSDGVGADGPGLTAYESGQPLFAIRGALDGALARDGGRLFLRFPDRITAIDTRDGGYVWEIRDDAGASEPWARDGALALSADQRTLAWYANDRAGAASLTLIDADSGVFARRTELRNPPLEQARLALAADGTPYLLTSALVAAIDLENGAVEPLHSAAPGQLAATLSPDGATIAVLENGAALRLIDADSRQVIPQQILDLPAERLPQWPQQLAFSPRGSRLAISGLSAGQRYLSGGRIRQSGGGGLTIIFNPADGAIVTTHREDEARSSVAAYASAGPALYVAAADGLARWVPSSRGDDDRRLVVEAAAPIKAVLVGPPVERRPAAAYAPNSEPPALVRTLDAPQPLAWLWIDRFSVLEFLADASRRLVAERVLRVIPRPGAPPLLLVALPAIDQQASGTWAIVDPGAPGAAGGAVTTTLAMAAPRGSEPLGPGAGFVLSPDGGSLAFLTSVDPFPGDDNDRPRQLVRADLASGAVEVLLDPAIFGALINISVEDWDAAGIYLRASIRDPGTSIAQWVWRFDPDTPGATPKAVLVASRGEPTMAIDGRAGLIAYQPHPRDIERSELRLHRLAGGGERTIYVGPFIDRQALRIAPDGAAVAFLRPLDGGAGVELVRYDLASGTAQILASGVRGATLQSLPDGLALRSPLDPGGGPRRQHIFRWEDGALLRETLSTPPGLVVADRLSDDGERLAEAIYVDGRPLLRVSQPGDEPIASVPIFRLPSDERADEYIVYVP